MNVLPCNLYSDLKVPTHPARLLSCAGTKCILTCKNQCRRSRKRTKICQHFETARTAAAAPLRSCAGTGWTGDRARRPSAVVSTAECTERRWSVVSKDLGCLSTAAYLKDWDHLVGVEWVLRRAITGTLPPATSIISLKRLICFFPYV